MVSKVGIVALQGAFAKHAEILGILNQETIHVRRPKDLETCDGLIIPGGESTAIIKLLDFSEMREAITRFAAQKPIFGTCAGIILMANKVVDYQHLACFNLFHITLERNSYGRQVDSFQTMVDLVLPGHSLKKIPAVFIRAPRILSHASSVEVLASLNGKPILIREGRHLGATFHPELTKDTAIHQLFIDAIKGT